MFLRKPLRVVEGEGQFASSLASLVCGELMSTYTGVGPVGGATRRAFLRMLNHSDESLVLQIDFPYMLELVDFCIDFLKAHVCHLQSLLPIIHIQLILYTRRVYSRASSAKQSLTSSTSNNV